MTLPKELQERFDHVKENIFFDWKGQSYSVPFSAYPEANYIFLPDTSTLLKVLVWTETMPPVPHFSEIKNNEIEAAGTIYSAVVDYTNHLG